MNEDLAKMLLDLQKSIGEIDKNQAVASEKIDNIKENVSDVQKDVKEMSSKITNLDNRLSKIENKKTIEDHIATVGTFMWSNKIVRYATILLTIVGLNIGLKYCKMPAIDVSNVVNFINQIK